MKSDTRTALMIYIASQPISSRNWPIWKKMPEINENTNFSAFAQKFCSLFHPILRWQTWIKCSFHNGDFFEFNLSSAATKILCCKVPVKRWTHTKFKYVNFIVKLQRSNLIGLGWFPSTSTLWTIAANRG